MIWAELEAAVVALLPQVREAAPRIEAEGRLPDGLFASLAATGVFKAHLPPHLGGCGASLSRLGPLIEGLARADGSTGWLAYVGSEANRQVLRLDAPTAQRIATPPDLFIAGMFTAGSSRAVACDGGYRVSGRWHTCSGSLHCTWLIGGSTVYEADGETVRRGPSGQPLSRLNFIPRSTVEVLDTWHVAGLKGTNSHDVRAEDVFVPEPFGAYDVEPPDLGLHLMVPLGIARAAMDEFVALAAARGPSKAQGARYRDLPAVQRQVAAAEASLRAARCYALASLAEVDARAAAGEPTTPAQRDAFFLAAAHAARTAVEVVDTLHRAAGTSAIFTSSRLLRCFLDVHVAVAHVSLQPINLESAGRTLLQS
jgi:alkylation response protein AidB-like acyl-CoA dehydrogenase